MARDQRACSMSRRGICRMVAGVLVAPGIAIAQAWKAIRRIGWLQGGAPDSRDEEQQVDEALAEVGLIVGQNILLDRRYVRFDDLSRTVTDFVNARLDIIITNGTAATLAAKNATSTIPILMWSASDPVAAGLVASLARPGGNVTGYALLSPEQRIKRLSLLRELLPGIRRVAELDDSTNPGLRVVRKRLEEAYQSVGMEAIFVDVSRFRKSDDVLAEIVQRRAEALNIREDALPKNWVTPMLSSAIRVPLPTIVDTYELLEMGALLSYDSDTKELLRRNAALLIKLLRGTNPADLPVEQPTKFNLGVNLRTAKALGVTVPQVLLLRADKVIR